MLHFHHWSDRSAISPGNARWGMVERGQTQFSYRMINSIKQKLPTVDTEWLRDGLEGKMPIGMMKGLSEILERI